MTCEEAIERLRTHRLKLYEMGIEHVAVFGSTARGESHSRSDLDLLVKLRSDMKIGWDYFTLDERVAALLGVDVDIVSEPISRDRFRAAVDRDRVDAF